MRNSILVTAIFVLVFLTGACAGGGETREENGEPTNGGSGQQLPEETSSGTAQEQRAPDAEGTGMDGLAGAGDGSILELLIDLAAFNAGSFLEGRIMGLAGAGGEENGEDGPDTGVLWLRSSRISKLGPETVRFDIEAQGWLWIEEEREELGATFGVEEIIPFSVDISLTGTFNLVYDTEARIVTAWFIPTEPARSDFEVIGEVEVDEEGLWSSIVGAVGRIIGQDPDEQAKEAIQEQGGEQFEERLDAGMTIAVDLCSGRRFVDFGTYPAGQLPDNAEQDASIIAQGTGRLHPGGLLMAGPLESDAPILTRIEVTEGSGEVEAFLVHEEDAGRIAEAFIRNEPFPDFIMIGQDTASDEEARHLGAALDPGNPMVLVMRQPEGQNGRITFRYEVSQEGVPARQPLVECGE